MIRALLEIISTVKRCQEETVGHAGRNLVRPCPALPPSLSRIKVENRGERWMGLCLDTHFSSADDGDDNSKELRALAYSLWLKNGSHPLMSDRHSVGTGGGGDFCWHSAWHGLEVNIHTFFLSPPPSSLSLSPSLSSLLPLSPVPFWAPNTRLALGDMFSHFLLSILPSDPRRQHDDYTHFTDGAFKVWPCGSPVVKTLIFHCREPGFDAWVRDPRLGK